MTDAAIFVQLTNPKNRCVPVLFSFFFAGALCAGWRFIFAFRLFFCVFALLLKSDCCCCMMLLLFLGGLCMRGGDFFAVSNFAFSS